MSFTLCLSTIAEQRRDNMTIMLWGFIFAMIVSRLLGIYKLNCLS